MNWTVERIREEMRRLDERTGLNASSLPINLTEKRGTLGSFQHTKDGKPLGFTFSLYYLNDPEFSRAQRHVLIYHEYAHYMDLVRGGAGGHGESWKRCCREIGILPSRYYNRAANTVQRKMEKAEDKVSGYMKRLSPGMRIWHPSFGEGLLTAMLDDSDGARMTIRFESGTKTLNARWVFAYCKLIREKE